MAAFPDPPPPTRSPPDFGGGCRRGNEFPGFRSSDLTVLLGQEPAPGRRPSRAAGGSGTAVAGEDGWWQRVSGAIAAAAAAMEMETTVLSWRSSPGAAASEGGGPAGEITPGGISSPARHRREGSPAGVHLVERPAPRSRGRPRTARPATPTSPQTRPGGIGPRSGSARSDVSLLFPVVAVVAEWCAA